MQLDDYLTGGYAMKLKLPDNVMQRFLDSDWKEAMPFGSITQHRQIQGAEDILPEGLKVVEHIWEAPGFRLIWRE